MYRQDADGGWQEFLDTRYERIVLNKPGEEDNFQPVNMVEAMLKEINRIVWQQDADDLDIPLDINMNKPKNWPINKAKTHIQMPMHDA